MQVFVSFPDAGYPDVVFEAVDESLVADATQTAADEWGADAEFLEMSFSGSVIPQSSRLVSHGVEAGSQLIASLLQVFGCKWFTDDGKRAKLMQHLSKIGEQHLSLDTPSFASDGCFRFNMEWIQNPIIEISFINPCPSITSAEFLNKDPFETTLSDGILSNCSKVDVTGLRNVTQIDDYFLGYCPSLSTLSLGSFNNVTQIADYFLDGCRSLTTLDFRSFNNVTQIGDYFLCGCSSLTALERGCLNRVTQIGHSFLDGCRSLTTFDLTSSNNVTQIGAEFLNECSSLSTLNLGNLNNITELNDYFLNRCSSLSTLDLRSLNNVTRINVGFLNKCSSLTAVDVTGLSPESEV